MITSLTLIIGLGEFAHRVFSATSKQTFRIPYHHIEFAFLLKKTQMCIQGEKWSSPDILSACVLNFTQPIN